MVFEVTVFFLEDEQVLSVDMLFEVFEHEIGQYQIWRIDKTKERNLNLIQLTVKITAINKICMAN